MKKLHILILSLFLVILGTTNVFAVEAPTITNINASGTKTSVTISGTVSSDEMTAVMVEILDNSDNSKAMYSFAVTNSAFSGTINGLDLVDGTYTIRAANYDGGKWKSTRIVISSDSGSGPSRTAIPNTATK